MRAGDRARRLATWLLLGASLAGALLFVGLRLATPSDGGRVAFYEDAWTTAGVLISPIDPPQPDLAIGDRVEAVGDRSMEAWAGLVLDPSAARPAGGAVAYVVGRNGAEASIDVTWAAPATGSTLASGWSVVVFSVAIAAVAALRLRATTGRAGGHRADARGRRGGRQQRAVVPRHHDERSRPGRPVRVPRVPDRGPVHAHVARCRPPRARVPGADCPCWHIARG